MRLLNKYNFLLILLKDTINDDTMQRSRKRQVENYDGIKIQLRHICTKCLCFNRQTLKRLMFNGCVKFCVKT